MLPVMAKRVLLILARLAVVGGLVAFARLAPTAAAQVPAVPNPYPANNTPITLASGTVVRQRNLVVFRGRNGNSSLTITIETPTSATDSNRVSQEAREVAALHDEYARAQRIDRISVAVCRSQACLELREIAKELFHFERGADGTWSAQRSRPSSNGLSNER